MANDDWRVTVTLQGIDRVKELGETLAEEELEDEARQALGGRVIVGGGDDAGVIYLYTGTAEAAHEAARVVERLVTQAGIGADSTVERWHPVAERWEPEDVPLPQTEAQIDAEEELQEQDEEATSAEIGALWEVRVELPSHGEAEALADRLSADYAVTRRWKYLLVGTASEDDAKELAEKLAAEVPDATLHVEPSSALAWQLVKPSPFAVLGGLAS